MSYRVSSVFIWNSYYKTCDNFTTDLLNLHYTTYGIIVLNNPEKVAEWISEILLHLYFPRYNVTLTVQK